MSAGPAALPQRKMIQILHDPWLTAGKAADPQHFCPFKVYEKR